MSRTCRGIAAFALLISLTALSALAADEPQTPGLAAGTDLTGRKKIVFISGTPSHGYAQHEQYAGCMLLAKDLNENVPGVICQVYKHQWPTDEHAFDDAAAIVIFCDGGPGHIAIPHLKQLADLMDKGVGLGCIHYAVELPTGEAGDDFKKWIGGYFETFWSVNPTWTGHFSDIPQQEVTRGVHPFTTHDEWYYHMRFRDNMEGVTPILDLRCRRIARAKERTTPTAAIRPSARVSARISRRPPFGFPPATTTAAGSAAPGLTSISTGLKTISARRS